MKTKQFIFLLISFFLITSCSSNDSDDSSDIQKKYFIKYKINGVQKEDYITQTLANGSIGYFDGSSIFEEYQQGEFRIQFHHNVSINIMQNQFQVKTYEFNNSNTTPGTVGNLHYLDPQTNLNFSASTAYPTGNPAQPLPPGSNLKLIVSSFANNELKGTFSATFVASSGGTQKTFNITEGQFYAPLQ